MDKTYRVKIEWQYGTKYYFPACRVSKAFAQISRRITLTKDVQEIMKGLGYVAEQVHEQDEFLSELSSNDAGTIPSQEKDEEHAKRVDAVNMEGMTESLINE